MTLWVWRERISIIWQPSCTTA